MVLEETQIDFILSGLKQGAGAQPYLHDYHKMKRASLTSFKLN